MDFNVPIGRKSLAPDPKASLFDFSFGKSKSKTPQAAAPKAKTSRGMSGIEGATRSGALRDESPPGKRKSKVQTGSGSKKTKPNTSRGRSIRDRDASQESLPSSSVETTKRSGPEGKKSKQRDASQESLPSSATETTKRSGPEGRKSKQRDASQESLPSSATETTKRSGAMSKKSVKRAATERSGAEGKKPTTRAALSINVEEGNRGSRQAREAANQRNSVGESSKASVPTHDQPNDSKKKVALPKKRSKKVLKKRKGGSSPQRLVPVPIPISLVSSDGEDGAENTFTITTEHSKETSSPRAIKKVSSVSKSKKRPSDNSVDLETDEKAAGFKEGSPTAAKKLRQDTSPQRSPSSTPRSSPAKKSSQKPGNSSPQRFALRSLRSTPAQKSIKDAAGTSSPQRSTVSTLRSSPAPQSRQDETGTLSPQRSTVRTRRSSPATQSRQDKAVTLSPQRTSPRTLPSSPTNKSAAAAGTSSNTTRSTLSEAATPRVARSPTKSTDSAFSQRTSPRNPLNIGVVDAVDNIDESAEVVVFVIDQDEQAYMALQNSDVTNNRILAPQGCTEVTAGFIQPEFNRENSEEEEDGITKMHPVELNSRTGIGYVKIQGRTVHPPQLNDDVTLSYWVISRNITVRSVGGAFNVTGREENYLYPKKLSQGSCIVIPKNCLYTLENWDSCDAILAYCYSRDDESATP